MVDAMSVMRPHGLYGLSTTYNICGGTMLDLQLCAKIPSDMYDQEPWPSASSKIRSSLVLLSVSQIGMPAEFES
jgi:hypothetical protein